MTLASTTYPLIHETMIASDEWKKWCHYQMYESNCIVPKYDIVETEECGWMSKEHWDAFVDWIKTRAVLEYVAEGASYPGRVHLKKSKRKK